MGELVSDYTPTTEEVRTEYMRTHPDNDDSALGAEFDRWFEAEIEKAARYSAEATIRHLEQQGLINLKGDWG